MPKHSLHGSGRPTYGSGIGKKRPNIEFSFLDAMRDSDIETIKSLIEEDPSLVKSRDPEGKTPLHRAAERGRRAVAEVLIANGADVNAQDKDGYSPLHWAARRSKFETMTFLLDSGADVN